MHRYLLLGAMLCGVSAVIGGVNAEQPSAKANDVLEGVLRVHPKFHFKYYIDGFGGGQECALFQGDDRLNQIKPGSIIRVRGKLASKFFGDANPNPKTSALISTWIIYMDVDAVEVIRNPVELRQQISSPASRGDIRRTQ